MQLESLVQKGTTSKKKIDKKKITCIPHQFSPPAMAEKCVKFQCVLYNDDHEVFIFLFPGGNVADEGKRVRG